MARPKKLARAVDHAAHPLYEQVRRRIARAVDNVCEVAGGTDGRGNPNRISQAELAQRAAIPRATLYKYLSCRRASAEVTGSPTLRDVVGIAHALNIPPAFLLFTDEDWARVDAALLAVIAAVQKKELGYRMQSLGEELQSGRVKVADLSLELAPLIFGQHPPNQVIDPESGEPSSSDQAKKENKNRLLAQGLINTALVPRYERFRPKSGVESSASKGRGILAFLFSLAMAQSNGVVPDVPSLELD
ncbi:helix-turn-helix transcriptional regulator [Paraburkholderia sp. A1BS-2L]|uniref:helix-turn-helix domain-containing protein n=1 Tax=Paraburkholderia sp. A1BS-2L TaxID=3028373 RepID=UPI003DA9C873